MYLNLVKISCFHLWDTCSLNHTYNEQFLYVCIPNVLYRDMHLYGDINYDDI